MAKSTDKLERKIRNRPGAAARIDARTEAMQIVLRLAELRERRDKTQAELAAIMQMTQANVSRIEHADNLYLATLAGYIAALGGRVEINAVFSDDVVPLGVVDDREHVRA